jgi:beta-glucanase (GH16 family)
MSRIVRTLLTLTMLGLTACDGGVVVPPDPSWFLTWSDEFNGEAGPIDESNWDFDIGTGENGWGNGELQFYTDRPENVGLDGEGRLYINLVEENFGGRQFTSARIKTQDLFTQRYGRMEARIQLPQGQGVWPAFWMLGADFPEVGWPQTGEIDIMEFRGQEPDVVHGSLHGPGYSGGNPITRTYRLPEGQNFVEDFHVFAVEWDPSRIAFLVDDETYNVVTSGEVGAVGEWVFDDPFFLILNVALGGTFVGLPDETTPLPQSMLVDYVRVFSRQPPDEE